MVLIPLTMVFSVKNYLDDKLVYGLVVISYYVVVKNLWIFLWF